MSSLLVDNPDTTILTRPVASNDDDGATHLIPDKRVMSIHSDMRTVDEILDPSTNSAGI